MGMAWVQRAHPSSETLLLADARIHSHHFSLLPDARAHHMNTQGSVDAHILSQPVPNTLINELSALEDLPKDRGDTKTNK